MARISSERQRAVSGLSQNAWSKAKVCEFVSTSTPFLWDSLGHQVNGGFQIMHGDVVLHHHLPPINQVQLIAGAAGKVAAAAGAQGRDALVGQDFGNEFGFLGGKNGDAGVVC